MHIRAGKSGRVGLCCVLAAYGTAATAATLAGVGFGGTSQGYAVCYLFNAGSTAVPITSKSFVREITGTSPPFIYDGCGSSIAPGSVCAFQSSIDPPVGYACRVTLGAGGANVRGELEFRDPSNSILLNSVELR